MQKLRKKLRLLGFILFIFLAAFAASIGVAIPVLPSRKDESNEINIEQPKSEHTDDETISKEIKP